MATDWLGQEYGPGDLIIYPAQSGRSVNMVKAQVVAIRDNGNVTVQPILAARWKQHYGRTKFIDKRTGKGIDPYRTDKHDAKAAYYTHPAAHGREFASWEDLRNALGYEKAIKGQYHPAQFKDYVERIEPGDRPAALVTLTVTKNITKLAA